MSSRGVWIKTEGCQNKQFYLRKFNLNQRCRRSAWRMLESHRAVHDSINVWNRYILPELNNGDSECLQN